MVEIELWRTRRSLHLSGFRPCFHKPLFHPGRSDFPSPVGSGSFPPGSYVNSAALSACSHTATLSIYPQGSVLLRPSILSTATPALSLDGVTNSTRYLPRAPLHTQGVTLCIEVSVLRQSSFVLLHHSYGLMRRTSSLSAYSAFALR